MSAIRAAWPRKSACILDVDKAILVRAVIQAFFLLPAGYVVYAVFTQDDLAETSRLERRISVLPGAR